METLGSILLVLGGGALVVFLHRLPYRKKGSKKELTGHAVVVSRTVRQGTASIPGAFSRWEYLVTFDLGSTRLELYVSEAQYRALREGTAGQLTWQYQDLLSFIPDNT